MKVTSFLAYGVGISVCECDDGEGIPFHKDNISHGHLVVRGRTFVEVGDEISIELTAEDGNRELHAGTKHRITAVENGTIFINVIPVGSNDTASSNGENGGVVMEDGTVVSP